tara:strand:+ start:2457 stop:3452 length:996 start_codon:yes stop_codon:yes gene_type:complete
MAAKLSKTLKYKHIRKAGDEIIKYMDDRRQGNVTSLKTRWKKFNESVNGGLEWGSIITIAGMSGSGKSSIANELETSLFDHNTDTFSVLSFNFEMLAMKQVGRKLSGKLDLTSTQLYSGTDSLKELDFQRAKYIIEDTIDDYDIYYVDIPGTVEQIYNTIKKFHAAEKKKKGDGYGSVIFLDHTLLTQGATGSQEREVLSRLYKMFMLIKKELRVTVIILSQLNRGIEAPDRISNPLTQYPMKKDIFGSDAVFHGSDIVMISHKPYMLHLQSYGPGHLPVTNPLDNNQAMIYWHIIKNREGEAGVVLSMLDNLKHSKIDEYNPTGNIKFEV